MENSKDKNRRNIGEDMFKVLLISEIPKLAKLIVNLIPDLTYERYIKNYKLIWNMAFPAASLTTLQKYVGSELEKTFIVQMSAGIINAINERANKLDSPGVKITGDEQLKNTSNHSLFFAMTSLDKKDLINFTKLLTVLSENQRSRVLNLSFSDKTEAEEFLKTLVSFDQEQFKSWSEVMLPEEKPKEKNEFEQKLTISWNEFVNNANAFFQKDSFLVRIAKEKGLM